MNGQLELMRTAAFDSLIAFIIGLVNNNREWYEQMITKTTNIKMRSLRGQLWLRT